MTTAEIDALIEEEIKLFNGCCEFSSIVLTERNFLLTLLRRVYVKGQIDGTAATAQIFRK